MAVMLLSAVVIFGLLGLGVSLWIVDVVVVVAIALAIFLLFPKRFSERQLVPITTRARVQAWSFLILYVGGIVVFSIWWALRGTFRLY